MLFNPLNLLSKPVGYMLFCLRRPYFSDTKKINLPYNMDFKTLLNITKISSITNVPKEICKN